jgi:hypothetical protein
MHYVVTGQWPSSALHPGIVVDFYREELIRHQRCLRYQREYYSERAYTSAEQALVRLLANLDQVCRCKNADRLMVHLLEQFDVVTNLSAWSNPRTSN